MTTPRRRLMAVLLFTSLFVLATLYTTQAWTPLPVADDPLVRMPGTQPDQNVSLEAPDRCLNCHAGYDQPVEPGYNWQGSMMSQSARDFLFWACLTVAGQDSIWAVGTPNAVDICERCHFPAGWLAGRSDPPNASAMTGADFDGVHCDLCHRMYDPFFTDTYSGKREGDDWLIYWDETNLSATPSMTAALTTYDQDLIQTQAIALFNGNPFYEADNLPFSPSYTETASGQYFVSAGDEKRASFADATARHTFLYSRYHKSRYFCSTCHDVSNPVMANLAYSGTVPGDGTTILPTEIESAYAYYHVERTFSEFMLSAYGLQGGAPGVGPFAPDAFDTSLPNDYIARCQDCHMRDVVGQGCDKNDAPVRPTESIEHPNSGLPMHDMVGGNAWVAYVLASAVSGSANYDPVNDQLLNQGPAALTLDLGQGLGIDPAALLDGADRAQRQLEIAAAIENLAYEPSSGQLSFRVQNQTGHKLISGFPEGRRMFVNVEAHSGGNLVYHLNPYDDAAGTLKGLNYPYTNTLPPPDPLGPNEVYSSPLVYEMHPSSSLTGEDKTFHFALADGRHKDNRIPPQGFRANEAAERLSQPVWEGSVAPDYFTPAEYAGGYDAITLTLPPGAEHITVSLYYQTTSREYVEFLRDEINGSGNLTLYNPPPSGEPEAYIIQTDPFFDQLRAWGDTIWQLWVHNMNVPGAAPYLMTQATWQGGSTVTARFTAWPVAGPAPLDVLFSNTSSGDYTSSLWHFGDGITSTLKSPTHTYSSAGTYTVSLAVSGPGGSASLTRTHYITTYEPVQAGFAAWPTAGVAPLTVAFTNTSSGDYSSSLWHLSDGVTSTLQHPNHTYPVTGAYTVSLTVSGLGGSDSLTRTRYITVYQPVQASFAASPTTGVAPLTVAFTNTSSGDYTASLWHFGDGVTSTLESPSHVYGAGTYTVTLVVSGPGGTDSLSRTRYITATPSPNQAPRLPFDPNPADEAAAVPLTPTLSWRGGDPDGDPVTYTLAFGPNDPPPVVAASLTVTRYQPGDLDAATTYYWAITASDGLSTTAGPTWRFTTASLPPTCTQVTSVTLAYTNAGAVYTDTLVHFVADVLPADADPDYQYLVRIDGADGDPQSASQLPLTFQHTFNQSRSHTVEVAVWNCQLAQPEAVTTSLQLKVFPKPQDCVPLQGVTILGETSGGPGDYVLTTEYVPGDASPPISYLWDDGSTLSTTVRSLDLGVHTLRVTATNCLDVSVIDTHTITITAPSYALYLPVVIKKD